MELPDAVGVEQVHSKGDRPSYIKGWKMPEVQIEKNVLDAMKKLRRSDRALACRIQELIDQIAAGGIPQGSERMCNSGKVRSTLGTVPYKLSQGKLRLIFDPGQRIIALGHRSSVYTSILGPGGWTN